MMLRAALLFLALALAGLGVRGLNEPDESRYGEVAREMLVTGDWIVPRLKGTPHLTKPPLTYWAVASSQAVFGFGPWGMRFWSALAAAGTALLLFDFGRRAKSERRGLIAGAVFLLSFEGFALGRILTTDMFLTFFATAALAARFAAATASPSFPARRAPWLFWLALGLGFLTKGPVVLLVVGGALLGARWTAPGIAWGRGLRLVPGFLLFALIGLSWFAVLVARDPGLLDFFLGGEVVDRVAGGRGRRKAFWYFIAVLPIVLLPFSGLALREALRALGPKGRLRETDRASAFARAWVWLPFLGFSLAASKLWTYMLPLVPAFAILASARLEHFIAQGPEKGRSGWDLALTRFFWLPARGLARVFHREDGERRRRLEVLLGLALTALVWQGVQFAVAARQDDLHRNTSYADFWPRIEAASLGPMVGARLDGGLAPRDELPGFPEDGLAVVSYGLRAPSACFALLGRRPEFVPNYEGRSIWKIASRAESERRFRPDDLKDLLGRRGEVLVLVKRDEVEELRTLLAPAEDLVVATGGRGKSEAWAIRFRRAR